MGVQAAAQQRPGLPGLQGEPSFFVLTLSGQVMCVAMEVGQPGAQVSHSVQLVAKVEAPPIPYTHPSCRVCDECVMGIQAVQGRSGPAKLLCKTSLVL